MPVATTGEKSFATNRTLPQTGQKLSSDLHIEQLGNIHESKPLINKYIKARDMYRL